MTRRREPASLTPPTQPVPPALSDELPEGFKMTELGPLPEEWEAAQLHLLGQICAGGPAPQGSQYFGGTHPFVRVQHLEEEGYEVQRWDLITDEAVRRYRLRLFPAGTIVFPKSGASIRLEKRAVLARASYLVSHLCAIVPNNDVVDGDFLFFALRAIPLAAEKAEGYPTLSLTEIRQRCVPLPPMCEQRAVAHVLRTVQRAKEATERVVGALKELKKSLMRHLFTYGPVSVTERERVALQESEIGPIPAHWRVVRLGEVVYHVRDTVNPMSYPDERFEYYSIPAYQSGQQPALETGRDIRSAKIVVRSGTVLFGKLNPRVPKIWLVESASPRRKIASTEFIALVPNHVQLDSSFLYFLSWTPFVLSKAQELIAGSTPSRQRVDVRAFLQLPIRLPPLDEQREIARILQAVDAKIVAEQARRAALEALFKTLLHDLMTARRRLPGKFIAQFSKGTGHG
jgi:type I restriction enzyme S subunit